MALDLTEYRPEDWTCVIVFDHDLRGRGVPGAPLKEILEENM